MADNSVGGKLLAQMTMRTYENQQTAFHDELVQLLALGYDLDFADIYQDERTRAAYFAEAYRTSDWLGQLVNDVDTLPRRLQTLRYRLIDDASCYIYQLKIMPAPIVRRQPQGTVVCSGILIHRRTRQTRDVSFYRNAPYCWVR